MLGNLLSIRVLANPKRRERAEELANTLNCSIVWSEDEDGWLDTRKAWTELANDGGEFGLVIRDNAVLEENFIEEVQKLIIRTYHYRTAYQLSRNLRNSDFIEHEIEAAKERNYIFTHHFEDGNATILPRNLIRDMVKYGNQSYYVGSDIRIKTFLLRYAIPVTYPYNSLCTIKPHERGTEN